MSELREVIAEILAPAPEEVALWLADADDVIDGLSQRGWEIVPSRVDVDTKEPK